MMTIRKLIDVPEHDVKTINIEAARKASSFKKIVEKLIEKEADKIRKKSLTQ